MRLAEYLCLAGVEVSNGYRVAEYVGAGIPGVTMGVDCQCEQLNEGFIDPLTDPAPWYEPTRPESADFYGFWANDIVLGSVAERNVVQNGKRGSSLGALAFKGRTVQVSGLMLARSGEGQSYGERWLAAALRGSPCDGEGCASDDLTILPACPEEGSYDGDRYFRTLVNAGLIDGPIFSPAQTLPEWYVQQASFVLASEQPYLYHPATRCIDHEVLADYYGSEPSCALTTPEWMGEGTFVIEVENTGTTDAEGIVIQGRISLDGSCPVTGLGTSVPPSWSYTIPTLAPEDRLVIDGMRRRVELWDASAKYASAGLGQLSFDGPFKWPDVGPCTTMCVTFDIDAGETSLTVDSHLREL